MTTPSVPPIALAGEPDLIKRICDAIREAEDEAEYLLDWADCINIIENFAAPTPSASSVPVAEIVRWKTFTGHDGWDIKIFDKGIEHGTKLYAAPLANPAPSVLTDAQIMALWKEYTPQYGLCKDVLGYSRAILQANGATHD